MQRGQSDRAAPGPIFGRAFRQTLIGATFPNRNGVSLKSDIVSKQCPCMPLDTETCFGKSKTFVRQGEDVVASKLRKCERKDGLCKIDRTKSSLTSIKKASLTTHLWWKVVKVRADLPRFLTRHSLHRYGKFSTLHAKLAAQKSSVTHRIRRVSNLDKEAFWSSGIQ